MYSFSFLFWFSFPLTGFGCVSGLLVGSSATGFLLFCSWIPASVLAPAFAGAEGLRENDAVGGKFQ